MKKLLTSIVALCILFTMCFVGAIDASAAKYKINWDDWDIEDGVLYGYWGDEVSDLLVPSMDQFGVRITMINSHAFLNHTYLENVIVSEGIEMIGGEAFKGCTNLKKVELPASLTSFTWGNVFTSCTSLESIVIPGGVSEIPVGNFSDCTSLEEIIFTPGGEDITLRMFAFNGTNPRKVVLTDNVVAIHSTAFYNLKLTGDCEIIFCNPNVALGGGEDNVGNVSEATKPILGVAPGYDVNGNVTTTYLKGSTAQKWFEETMFNYNGQAGVEYPPYPKKNAMTSETYFQSLEENKAGYGKAYAAPDEAAIYEMFCGDSEPAEDPFAAFKNTTSGATSGTESTTSGGGTTTVVGGDPMAEIMPIIIIACCVFGGLILIVIIVVVIIVVVNANKKKKKRAARAAKLAAAKAAEAAPEAEAQEPAAEEAVADEVFDEPEAEASDAE